MANFSGGHYALGDLSDVKFSRDQPWSHGLFFRVENTSVDDRALISKWSSDTAQRQWLCRVGGGTAPRPLEFFVAGDPQHTTASSIQLDTWYYLGVSCDGVVGGPTTVSYYVVDMSGSTVTSGSFTHPGDVDSPNNMTAPVLIGIQLPTGGDPMDGDVAWDWWLDNIVLTEAQHQDIATTADPETEVKSHEVTTGPQSGRIFAQFIHPLDGTSDPDVDLSSLGNDADLVGSVAAGDEPPNVGGGGETAEGTGASAATATATATGTTQREGVGASTATSTAEGTGTSQRSGAGASAATATATGAGSTQRSGTATSGATATATATGSAAETATGTGESQATATATASGTSQRTGAATSTATAGATAAGTTARSGAATSEATATATATGTAALVASGAGASSAVASVSATGVRGGLGAGDAQATGQATGTGTRSSIGLAQALALAEAFGVGTSQRFGAGSSAATASATATGLGGEVDVRPPFTAEWLALARTASWASTTRTAAWTETTRSADWTDPDRTAEWS